MKLHLKIIEADNIPKMDLFGKADPFVSVHLSESKDSDKTKYIEKTYTPKWNHEMHLRVASISEDVVFELKDHDPAGKVDLIGTIERKIKQFQPGIINEEWINVKKAKGVKKVARVHLISHLTLEGMTPFVQLPFQFLKVCVKVISATDIEKMDTIGKTDPYVVLWIQSCSSLKQKTRVIKNNMKPRWNEEFTLEVLNQTSDILSFKMWDKDVLKDDEMATLDIPLGQFQLFEIVEKEYEMKPVKGVKKGGKIQLKIQVIPLNETKWKTGIAIPAGPGQEEQLQSFMQQIQSMQQSGMMQSQTATKQPLNRQIEADSCPQQNQMQQQLSDQSYQIQQTPYNQAMMTQQQMYNQAYQMQQCANNQTYQMQQTMTINNQSYQMQQPTYEQTMSSQQVMYNQNCQMQPGMYNQGMFPPTAPVQQAIYNQAMAFQPAMYPPGMLVQPGMYNQGIPPSVQVP